MKSRKQIRRLSTRILSCTLVLGFAGVACSGTATKSQKAATGAGIAGDKSIAADRSGSGGVLTIAMSASNVPIPNTPPTDAFEGRRFVGYQVYDGLLNFDLDQVDKAATPHPGLAESWKVGKDKLTWTLELRDGVKFHDGTRFDADAAVFNLDRMLDKDFKFYDQDVALNNAWTTSAVKSYRAVDEDTLEVKTKFPWSILPWDMSLWHMASPTAIQKAGNEEYPENPVGTGPFRVTKYVDGQVMELEPFEDYWNGKPKLDKIVLRPMPDPAARVAALQSGEVQWAEVPPPDSIEQLRSEGFNVLLKQYPHTLFFHLNQFDKPFDDLKVRKAFQYAIDRKRLCSGLLDGLCAPAHQLAYEGHPWFDKSLGKEYSYNPKKAKALLAEAGYPNGVTIEVGYPTAGSGNMWPQPMMEFLRANLKEAGIDMKITPMEWNALGALHQKTFTSPEVRRFNALWGTSGVAVPANVTQLLSSTIPPKGCCNTEGYSSKKFDSLFQDAMEEFEPAKSDVLFAEALGSYARDSTRVYAAHDLNLRVLSPKVRGFRQGQHWFADLRNVWVKEKD